MSASRDFYLDYSRSYDAHQEALRTEEAAATSAVCTVTPAEIGSVSLEADVIKLQETHSIINRSGKTFICWHDSNRATYEFQEIGAFHQFHAHRYHYVFAPNATRRGAPPTKKVKTTDAFLESPNTRRYEAIVFDPRPGAPTKYWNLWKGFKVAGVAGDTQPFLDLLNALADHDKASVEYLLNYLSHMVQKPEERPEVAIVMRGGQGTGKGTLMQTVGGFTDNYKPLTSTQALTGDFNGHLLDAFIVFADEAVWGGDKVSEGRLKTMITEPTIFINEKHKGGIHVANYIRLFVASNEDWAVPVGEADRRYFVLDVSDQYKGATGPGQFFHRYYAWLNAGGREAVFALLSTRNISKFNPRNFPRTKAWVDLMVKNLSLPLQFIFELLNGTIDVGPETQRNVGGVVRTYRNALFDEFREWCRLQNKRYVPTADEFGKAMSKAFCFADDNPSWRVSWKAADTKQYYYRLPGSAESMRRFARNVCGCEPNLVFLSYKMPEVSAEFEGRNSSPRQETSDETEAENLFG